MLYLNRKWGLASFWMPILFFLIFFYFPVIFFLGENFSFSGLFSFLTDTLYIKIFSFTFKEAFLSAFLTTLLALPGAYLVARTHFRGRSIFLSLSLIAFVMPGISVALGFVLLFGRRGLFFSMFGVNIPILYTFWAIILAHIFYNFALSVRIIGSQWEKLSINYEEEAKIQGANALQVFYFVDLPYLFPSILSSFFIIFIYSFMSFAIVLVLGGVRYVTLEVEIYMYLTKLINFVEAAKLVWIQFIVLLIFAYLLLITKRGITFEYENDEVIRKGFPIWGYIYLIIVAFIVFVPMGAMLLGGFWDFIHHRITLLWFRNIFSQGFSPFVGTTLLLPIGNTFRYGIYTVLLTIILVVLGSFYIIYRGRYKNLFSLIFISSLFISPITLAFSYIFLGNWIFIPSRILIVLAHSMIALPVAMQIFFGARESVPLSLREAAFIDGAGILKTFIFVELPMLIPALISTITITFAISIGEVGATLLLYEAPENMTISVAMVRLLSARRLGETQAYSTLLFIIAFLLFVITDIFLRKTNR